MIDNGFPEFEAETVHVRYGYCITRDELSGFRTTALKSPNAVDANS